MSVATGVIVLMIGINIGAMLGLVLALMFRAEDIGTMLASFFQANDHPERIEIGRTQRRG